ncbi:MAG: hypothetical protein RX316_10590 [bacterium]|nr:hypothetical protein [bacterium]
MKKSESPMEGISVPEITAVKEEEPPKTKESAEEEPQDVYQLMDQRDEAQIVATLEGMYLDEFVYEMNSGGRPIVGLSWIGIQEASRAYGGIQCRILEEQETETHVVVTVEAKDIKTGSVRVGRSRQALMRRLPSGQLQIDSFADVKAVSKAQRNAIRQLLPQALLKQWIDQYRNRDSKQAQDEHQKVKDNELKGYGLREYRKMIDELLAAIQLLTGEAIGEILEAHSSYTKKDGTVVPGIQRPAQITRKARAQTIYGKLKRTLERLQNGQEPELE